MILHYLEDPASSKLRKTGIIGPFTASTSRVVSLNLQLFRHIISIYTLVHPYEASAVINSNNIVEIEKYGSYIVTI